MTWNRAAIYLAIWALLTAYYVVFEQPVVVPVPENAARQDSAFLDFDASEVVGLEVESDSRRVRAAGDGDHWQIAEPAGSAAPADLVAALVTALTAPAAVEIVAADGARAPEFGLAGSARRIRLERRDGSRTTIVLGNRNPAQTAVYARREGAAGIVLLGLDVQYYFDLLLDSGVGRGQ